MVVCNQNTLLFSFLFTSRLVTILKVIKVPIQVSDILGLTVNLKLINFSSQVSLLFVLEMSTNFTSYTVNLYCFDMDPVTTKFSPASFFSKNREHSSSNHGLCCFNSHRPRLSLAEILIPSLMFSQAITLSAPKLQNCLRF